MKKLFLFTIYLLISLMGLASCDKLSRDISINLSADVKPHIVVNGFVCADKPSELSISKTIAINEPYGNGLDNAEIFGIKEAVVRAYVNGGQVEEKIVHFKPAPGMEHPVHAQKGVLKYSSDFRPKPGDAVRFEISSPELDPVTVNLKLPLGVRSLDVRSETVKGVPGAFGQSDSRYRHAHMLKMIVSFEKPRGGVDEPILVGYYSIGKSLNSEDIGRKGEYLRAKLRIADDPVFDTEVIKLNRHFNRMRIGVEDDLRFPYFHTSVIKSDRYELNLSGDLNDSSIESDDGNVFIYYDYGILLVLRSVDPFYYEWAQTKYGLKIETEDDDFSIMDEDGVISEQKTTLSNVEGGRGFVLGYTDVIYEISRDVPEF